MIYNDKKAHLASNLLYVCIFDKNLSKNLCDTLSISQEYGSNVNKTALKKSKVDPIPAANISRMSTSLGGSTRKMNMM